MVSWESPSADVIVSLRSSSIVQVQFWAIIGVQWVIESLRWFLISFRLFNSGGMSPVVLFKHLLVYHIIVISLTFDHGSLWFEIWSGVILILLMVGWHEIIAIQWTGNQKSTCSVPSKSSPDSSAWMTIWEIRNKSLLWIPWYTTFGDLGFLSNPNS